MPKLKVTRSLQRLKKADLSDAGSSHKQLEKSIEIDEDAAKISFARRCVTKQVTSDHSDTSAAEHPGSPRDPHPSASEEDEDEDQEETEADDEQGTSKKTREGHVITVTAEHKSSNWHTLINSFVCFIGAGILDLPYAFKESGWLLGTVLLTLIALMAQQCMYWVVDCKYALINRGHNVQTYGDVGFYALGKAGQYLVEGCLLLTQMSFCIAYIIFISHNVNAVFPVLSTTTVVLMVLPILTGLCLLRSLAKFAPVSLLAEVANAAGIVVIFFYDFEQITDSAPVTAAMAPTTLPFFFGVAIYCYEGVGMVLPIESNMANKEDFRKVWGWSMCLVTTLFLVFGIFGYLSFGADTAEIITLNLPATSGAASSVKLALSLGLLCTYPVMLFPVFEILEEAALSKFGGARTASAPFFSPPELLRSALRCGVVVFTAVCALLIPNFGVFLSFVGASTCSMLAFCLPATFNLLIRGRGPNGSLKQAVASVVVIVLGMFGAIIGTYVNVVAMSS